MTGASRPSVRVGKRALAALAAGSIAVPLSFGMMGGTAFAAAQGSSTPPAPISIQGVCPTGQTPNSNFPDTQTDFFNDAINCLAAYGVTQGYPDGNYKPTLEVNREQMALFFYRVGKAAGMSWNTSDAGFKDINTASSQEAKDAINALANAKVINGFTDGTYRPAVVVQRDAMAKFIANTIKVLGGPDLTTSANDYYIDDNGDIFENYINGITEGRISNGVDNQHYVPGAAVQRDAMAGFISRSMEVLFEAGKLPGQFGAVKLNSTSVAQGGTLTGTVQGTNVSVSGCGLTNQALPDTDTSASGTQFSVTIPSSQATGDCTLTFTYTGTNGQQQTAQRTITVTAGQSNQTYTVSPSGSATTTVNKTVTETVTGLGASPVDIQLFACSQLSNSGGATTFKGTNPGGSGNFAQPSAGSTTYTGGGKITVVNGTAVTPTAEATGVVPANGSLTFSFTDATPNECVVPVVFQQGTGSNANLLPLGTNNQPTVPFGVGQSTTFVPATPTTSGAVATGTVSSPTTTNFQQGGFTYPYSPSDTYQLLQTVGTTPTCVTDSYADFQQRLSSGDSVTGFFNPSGPNTYCLDDVAPPAPTVTGVTANTTSGGATVAFTQAATTESSDNITAYTIYRAPATPPATSNGSYTCPSPQPAQGTASPQTPPGSPYTAIVTVPSYAANQTPTTAGFTSSTAGGTNSYSYNDTTATAASVYCYAVSSVSPNAAGSTQTGTAAPATPAPVTAGAASTAKPAAPASLTATETASGTQLQFPDSVTANVTSYKVYRAPATVTNTSGTLSYSCPAAATTSPYTLLTSVADTNPSTAGTNTYTYTDTTGTSGTEYCYAVTSVNPNGESTPTTAAGPTATAPVFTGASYTAGASSTSPSTITVTYNEPIQCASVDSNGSDYAVSSTLSGVTTTPTVTAAACGGTVTNGTSNTVTITLSSTLAPGSTIVVTAQKGTMDSNTVLDVVGNAQPVGNSVQTTA